MSEPHPDARIVAERNSRVNAQNENAYVIKLSEAARKKLLEILLRPPPRTPAVAMRRR